MKDKATAENFCNLLKEQFECINREAVVDMITRVKIIGDTELFESVSNLIRIQCEKYIKALILQVESNSGKMNGERYEVTVLPNIRSVIIKWGEYNVRVNTELVIEEIDDNFVLGKVCEFSVLNGKDNMIEKSILKEFADKVVSLNIVISISPLNGTDVDKEKIYYYRNMSSRISIGTILEDKAIINKLKSTIVKSLVDYEVELLKENEWKSTMKGKRVGKDKQGNDIELYFGGTRLSSKIDMVGIDNLIHHVFGVRM